MRYLLFVFISFSYIGCTGRPPFLEYTLAQSALQSAQTAKSERHAALHWTKASKYYKQGKQKFNSRDYITAKRFFNEAIKWAERAENVSRFKISSGEVL